MRHAVPQDLHLSAGAVRLISRLPLVLQRRVVPVRRFI